MDLDYDAYPDFAALSLYVHRRGSVLALLVAEILDYRDRRATPRFAHEAGAMLLLLELLCDVRQHAQHGRFYLPEEEMERYGVHPGDLLAAQTTDRVRQLFARTGCGNCSPCKPSGLASITVEHRIFCRMWIVAPNPLC